MPAPGPERARPTRARFLAPVALAVAILAPPAAAQSIANYTVGRTTGNIYGTIQGSGSSVPAWRNGSNIDDNRSEPILIGFNFRYIGETYRAFSVSTNGYVDLSSSDATGASGAFGGDNATFSSNLTPTELALAPIYDDLIATSALDDAVKYQLTGIAGSRILTIEWIGMQRDGATSGSLNFQIKLFEANGQVQFNYGAMSNAGVTPSYTCGINGEAGPLIAPPRLVQQTANTATFSSVAQNALSALPAGGSRLTFAGIENVQPAAPTGLSVSSITTTTATLSFTDNSTSETFFDVFRSTNGTSFTRIGSVTSTTFNGTGSPYNFPLTGLQPGTRYWIRVTAENEVAAPSGNAEVDFLTLPRGVYTIATGNWGSAGTWSTGLVPSNADTVTVRDGHTVTLTQNGAVRRLTVGEGVGGILRYEAATARTLAVEQDVTIRPGALLATAASGTQTAHALTLGGSLHVNGTLDFSTNANTAGGGVTFTGAGSVLDGAGSADLRLLTVALPDTTDVLDIQPAALSFLGTNSPSGGVLQLGRGIAHLAGSYSLTGSLLVSNNLVPSAGLWLDNPAIAVQPHPSGGLSVRGLLRVSQGSIQVGDAVNEHLTFFSGAAEGPSTILVEGGGLLVAGGIVPNATNSMSFTQTGGVVEINRSGNGSTFRSFSHGSLGSVELAGGSFRIHRSRTNAASQFDWDAPNVTVTGFHTLYLGDPGAGGGQRFRLTGGVSRLEFPDAGGPSSVDLAGVTAHRGIFAAAADTVRISLTRTSVLGDDFIAAGPLELTGGAALYLGGGYFNPGASPEGSAPKDFVLGASITGTLSELEIEEPSGVMLSVTPPETLVTRNLRLTQGLLVHGGALGIGVAGQFSSITVGEGSIASAPIFLPAAGVDLSYFDLTPPRATGLEVPTNRVLRKLTIRGLTQVDGGTLDCQSLAVDSVLATSPGNEVRLASSATITPSIGDPAWARGYVDGPVIVTFNHSVPSPLKWFPLGNDSLFRPLGIQAVNTGGANRPCTLQVLRNVGSAFTTAPVGFVDSDVAYRLAPSGAALNPGTRLTVGFGAPDQPWSIAGARLAGAPAPGGPYADLGGLVTGGPEEGTIASTLDLDPAMRFFRIGETTPAVRVINPDGPAILALGQPTTIAVQTIPSAAIVRVDLYVSRTGPAGPWDAIATALPDSESYTWVVTGPEGSDVFFRAVVKDTLQRFGEDVSDSAVTIQQLAPTGVDDEPGPARIALAAPRPNPSAGEVWLEFSLPEAGRATLVVFDAGGREIARLRDGEHAAGRHSARWRAGTDVAPGLYFVRLDAGGRSMTRRVARVR